MLTDDSGPTLWDIAQLVPAVSHHKQGLIKFSCVDVDTAGRSVSHPPPQTSQRCSQTYLPGSNTTERKVFCFSEPTHRRSIPLDALLRWPSYCLNGFQALTWNDSCEKGTIQTNIKSLNCRSCPWMAAFAFIACDGNVHCICSKDKILSRMMLILRAQGVFFSSTITAGELSVFNLVLLSTHLIFDAHLSLTVKIKRGLIRVPSSIVLNRGALSFCFKSHEVKVNFCITLNNPLVDHSSI